MTGCGDWQAVGKTERWTGWGGPLTDRLVRNWAGSRPKLLPHCQSFTKR